MRYLNGFVLIGVALFFISIAGLLTGNRFLTEPGQAVNPSSWLLYLAASAIMLVNGGVSIWTAQQHEKENAAKTPAPETEAKETKSE